MSLSLSSLLWPEDFSLVRSKPPNLLHVFSCLAFFRFTGRTPITLLSTWPAGQRPALETMFDQWATMSCSQDGAPHLAMVIGAIGLSSDVVFTPSIASSQLNRALCYLYDVQSSSRWESPSSVACPSTSSPKTQCFPGRVVTSCAMVCLKDVPIPAWSAQVKTRAGHHLNDAQVWREWRIANHWCPVQNVQNRTIG